MLLLDEGNIIDDEYAGLADRGEVIDHPLRADRAIAAAIEGPGAAEGAIPRASARELDRGAGIEDADEIFAPVTQEVARRPHLVEMLDEAGPRSLAVRGDRAGHLGQRATIPGNRFEQPADARLALAFQDAIDRALAVLEDGGRSEGCAVAPDTDEGARQDDPGSLRQIDDLRHVGEVVAGERDEVRLPVRDEAVIVDVGFDLQVDEPDLMSAAAGSLRYELKA